MSIEFFEDKPPPLGKVIRKAWISRPYVREHAATHVFLFGDNMLRRGLGGQAQAMRGEPNAIGVPTKRRPESNPAAYFTDDTIFDREVVGTIDNAFWAAKRAMMHGKNVVVATEGLGTGLSELPVRAPRILRYINGWIAELEGLR